MDQMSEPPKWFGPAMIKAMDIDTKTARIKELDALIAPLREERSALLQSITESVSKFKIGDTIAWKSGSSWAKRLNRGRIVEIVAWCGDEAQWKVVRILKDGTDGNECWVRPYNDPHLEAAWTK